MSRVAGASIFTFQKVKRGHSMAQTGEILHPLLSYIHKRSSHQMIIKLVFRISHTFFFVFFFFFINSKRVGSDSREKRDLQHDPRHRTLHSHSNRPQWVQTHFSLLFCVRLHSANLFFLSVSPWLDNRGESRTPQRVRLKGILIAWLLVYTLVFYDDVAFFLLAVVRRLCCSACFVSVTSVFLVWQRKKVQFVSTTPHRLRKRMTSEFNVLQWK